MFMAAFRDMLRVILLDTLLLRGFRGSQLKS